MRQGVFGGGHEVPDINHLIRIAAPIDHVLPLVSTGNGFAKWWAEDVETDPGGVVRLGFFNRATTYALRRNGPVSETHVSWRCESGKEWSDTRIVFDLAMDKTEAVVRFTHGDWRDATDYFTSCNTTWGELMFRLKAAAEGKSPGPLFRRASLAY
jgi:hypothetical protein